MFDVIAIGDTTQDIFLGMTNASVNCDENKENCKICFDFAEKIAVDTKTDIPAVGNAANHAIGVARLGLRSAIYTVVGEDVQGHLSEDTFKKEGVNTKYLAYDPKHGTNFSCVINFQAERTIFVYHEPRDYHLPLLDKAQWLYLTSASGRGVEKLHSQTLEYLTNYPDVKLSFNPGTHQINLGLEKLKPLLVKTSILFLNKEESERILGVETRDIHELTANFHALGVKVIVITDGSNGSYVSDGQSMYYLPIFPTVVIERTGAGDSYGAAFLSAVIKGKALTEAMLWGNANSTSVVQYIGAREGLLGEDGIQKVINNNSTITPTAFNKQ